MKRTRTVLSVASLRRAVRCSLVAVCVLAAHALVAGVAVAALPGPALRIDSFAQPSSFSTSENTACAKTAAEKFYRSEILCDAYQVVVSDAGSAPTSGPVTVTDTLPAGLAVQKLVLNWSHLGFSSNLSFLCGVSGGTIQCTWPLGLNPDESLKLFVYVSVEPAAGASLTNTVAASGGGAPPSRVSVQNPNGSPLSSFGVSAFDAFITGADGEPDTQAGGHPYEYTTRIDLNNENKPVPDYTPHSFTSQIGDTSVQDLRDAVVDLPPGFIGSALATPTCSLTQLSGPGGCPPNTQVGRIVVENDLVDGANGPLFNVTPEHGVAAEYGFVDLLKTSHVLYVSVVPSAKGYVLRATSPEISQITLRDIVVTLYGNPALRDGSGNTQVAQFTNPSDCGGEPLITGLHIDSWQNPGGHTPDGLPDLSDPAWAAGSYGSPAVTGCDRLQFTGSLTAQPETTQAATPSGLNVELKVPQNEDPRALATPPLRKAVVTLPAGLAVNPSAADGLQTCSLAQIGLGNNSQPSCPEASKVASVEVETPALAGVLQGSVYLAAQNDNPFHTLLAGYIVVDDPTTGVLVKIPGRLDPDPVTGQVVATFDESPQFPFSDLRVHFFGGPRAPLATPQGCGTYTTNAVLTPWSAPDSGPPATSSDSFQITGGCGGGFSPSFSAGTTGNQAGAFSPFTTTFSRSDQDQTLSGVSVKLPPGLLGVIKGVERCPDPQADQGQCGPGSLIGHTTAAAGAGPNPFWVQGGQVFLTGPYKGAPFGLSVVVPAVAGPFNLGNVVVRAAISVDPRTAQITVMSDPLPTILQGIPLDVRTVNVAIDRAGFTFNPTSCEPLSVGGTLTSTQGTTAQVSNRFQAANCQGLPFKPSFKVSTQANTSKKNGASLDVRVGYPKGAYPGGQSQANIRSVAVTLPKALPSRLTTIQQACPEATFNANPASCPAGSVIGTATANTPVLANPVTGPAYLVSHGGAAFPDLVLILQGEGVTLELIGSINIKKQVTSSAFNAIPDAPISSFELKLPEGPHSGLAAVLPPKAKGNLCGTRLTMPTTITGQNGTQIKQNTKITVTGCSKAKKKHKAKKTKKKGRKK